MSTRYIPPQTIVAWSNAATGAAGVSTSLDSVNLPFITAYGTVSGATTITLQFSNDDSTYYDGPTSVMGGSGDFYIAGTYGARHVRLKSSNNVTVTAVLSAKG